MAKLSWLVLFSIMGAAVFSSRCWAEEEPASEASTPAAASEEQPASAPADEPPSKKTKGMKYDLRYKFTADEVVRSEVVHQAKVQTTIQGTSQTAETESKSIKAWQIKEVDAEGVVTFVYQVDSIDMWQRAQGRREIRYNSASDQEVPPGYEDVAKDIGVPLATLTMDAHGKILKRKEHRKHAANVSTQVTMPLPDRPIAIGGSWKHPIDVEVTLKEGTSKKIQTRQLFTLVKVEEEVAVISVDSQILTPIDDPAIEAQLIQRLSSGSVRFDIQAGRVLEQQLDLDRKVVGFNGPASSMHYETHFSEQLLGDGEQTVQKTPPPAAPDEKPSQPEGTSAKPKSRSRS